MSDEQMGVSNLPEGYWGPDADGDWVVNVLGTDLAFAVSDEAKARAVVAAIQSTIPAQDALVGELREALELFANGDIDVSEAAVIVGYPECAAALAKARALLAKLPAPPVVVEDR